VTRTRTLVVFGLAATAAAPAFLAASAAGASPVSVPPGADLQVVLDAARDGDDVVLQPGTWTGQFRVGRSIRLSGPDATLDGGGEGTVLVLEAPGVVVESLTIRNSGEDLGGPDCGVYVAPPAVGAIVRDLRIEDCAFGIWVHETRRVQVLDNRIVGRSSQHPSLRGNGVHLFDSDSLLVRGNRVSGARDGIYISATNDSAFEDNFCENQRFGIHYMFSQRNTLTGNVSIDNNSGYALMQSSDLVVTGNRGERCREHGILFRDAQRCIIRDNTVIECGEGMFFYSSTENEIVGNRLEGNEVGVKMWAGSLRNDIRDNVIVANRQQVMYVSSEDLELGETGRGNYWSDYLGWDQDGDGVGDRPYRVDSFTANLLYRFPSAALLLRSPSLELLSHLQLRLPFLKVPTVIDNAPLVEVPGS